MKRIFILLTSLSLTSLFSQNVAINDNGAVGNPNAILDVDVSTNNKGVLIPRLTTAQRTAIPGLGMADEGLKVYDETTNSFWFWDGTQWVQMQNAGAAGWLTTGNAGTNPATNFVGTTDNQSLVFRTNNTERVRILNSGNVGIGVANPAYNLEINGSFGYGNGTAGTYRSRTETRDNAGQATTTQSGFFETSNPVNYPAGATSWWHLIDVRHSNSANNYALQISGSFFDQDLYFRKTNNNGAQAWSRILTSTSGWMTTGNAGTNAATNFIGTTDNVDFVTRINNIERMRVNTAGNVGIGTATPMATSRLQVSGGAITPQTGNNTSSGIYFTPDPGGGGGDEAYIRHYAETGENTKLVIANLNDFDDDISLRTGLSGGYERVQVNGNGTVYLNRGVFFDCNDCGGGANGQYDMADGAGGNWGDLSIQGRVLSTNSNLHLSPPGGFRVIINSSYRAAGGATGTTGLDIEDGGIRFRKNYMYFQRYVYCNCYGAGSGTYDLGNWDFCALAHVGFKNDQSSTDEDDDVQCAIYPIGIGGSGEQTNYTANYTYAFNARPAWRMYLEAFQDTNGATCAANCMNFD